MCLKSSMQIGLIWETAYSVELLIWCLTLSTLKFQASYATHNSIDARCVSLIAFDSWCCFIIGIIIYVLFGKLNSFKLELKLLGS